MHRPKAALKKFGGKIDFKGIDLDHFTLDYTDDLMKFYEDTGIFTDF